MVKEVTTNTLKNIKPKTGYDIHCIHNTIGGEPTYNGGTSGGSLGPRVPTTTWILTFGEGIQVVTR